MKTVVTGASGFIGSHLMKRLPDAEPLGHDYLWQTPKADLCFYLATYGNLQGQNDLEEIIAANVTYPIQIATGIIGAFAFVSTSSVHLPVQTSYSRCKAATEQVLTAMMEVGKRVYIFRPYSVTGVGEQSQHLIPTLIRSCLKNEPVKFFPHATHDFIDVEDFISGMLTIVERESGGVFELGNGVPVSNQEVLNLVEIVCGHKANIIPITDGRPYDTADWFCRHPSTKPQKSLLLSIEQMVEHYKEHDERT